MSTASQFDFARVPPIVFVLGGPGSGKGTQCERLLAAANSCPLPSSLPSHIYHVNVGGLLREAQQEYRHKLENKIDIAGTHLAEAGPVLEAMMSTGNILPSWVTVTILRGHLEKIAAEVESGKHTKESRRPPAILIDGFPRSDENFIQFETLIGATRRLIVVDVDDEAMIHRIQQRGLTSGRADDQSLDTIRNRLRVFSQETGEVINKFTPYHTTEPVAAPVEVTADGRYVVKVDGNATPDDVTVGFQAAFLRLLDL